MAQFTGKITGLFLPHVRLSKTNLLSSRSSTTLWNDLKPSSESEAINSTSEKPDSNLWKIQKHYNYTSKINSGIVCDKIRDLKNIQKQQKDIIIKSTLEKTKINIPQKLNTQQRYVHTSSNLSRNGDIYMRTKLWNLSKEHKDQTNKLEDAMQERFGKRKFDEPQAKVKNRYLTYARMEEMKRLCDHQRYVTGYKKCHAQDDNNICVPCRVEPAKIPPCRPIKRVELTTECPKCPKCEKQDRYIEYFKRKSAEKPKVTQWK